MEFGNKNDLAKELISHERDLEDCNDDETLFKMRNWKEAVRVSKDNLRWQSEDILHGKIRWYKIPFDLFPVILRPRC